MCDILVSTDDPEIDAVARAAGALVPWLRPPERATDTSIAVDAALHALNWYEAAHGTLDGLLMLQPTTPFTRKNTIRHGISSFASHNCRSVLGVSPAASHPMWCFRKDVTYLSPFLVEHRLQMRSQDLPATYVVNGCFFLSAPAVIRTCYALYENQALLLVIDSPKETRDIDTQWDWQIAQWALSQEY